MEQVFNPYLPLCEYVPDGEPHVFDGRVYVYGSHDKAHGVKYCEGDYVTWSAPVDNLKDWRYEGVIYRRTQDPTNADDRFQLWAPDVTKGPDGRYYLYYCFSFYPEIGVAVADSPVGPFEFYGHVKYPAHLYGGKELNEHLPFDPAVLTDDDGRVYLYYGFAGKPGMKLPDFKKLRELGIEKITPEVMEQIGVEMSPGGMAVELEADMLTMKAEPHMCFPSAKNSAGTGFEGHGFYEASSIRKVGEKYYFVYSSELSHELSYAVSDRPLEGYVYGGALVSNGDIGLNGRTEPVNTLGNNHGGMVQIGEDWYIFYHRQTNGTEFSRQGCAEKLTIQPDGSIAQVEITSCGLNGGPLAAQGVYPASIACHLTSKKTMRRIDYRDPVMREQTRITEADREQYIMQIEDGTRVGYKYFDCKGAAAVALELRGALQGRVTVSLDEAQTQIVGEAALTLAEEWQTVEVSVEIADGTHALYFTFSGEGAADFRRFSFKLA